MPPKFHSVDAVQPNSIFEKAGLIHWSALEHHSS